MLRRIDFLNAAIDRISDVIEELPAPWEEQLQQAGSMPGRPRRAAQDIPAETGPDMTRFPTPGHLVSRAGRAPLDHQSGQRKGRGRRKKGNRYTGAVTGETSASAGRTQTREGARYRRLARRIGKDKAQVAVGATQLRVYHTLLPSPGTRYHDLGAGYYEKRAQARHKIRHHLAELAALGYDVALTPRPGPDDDSTSAGQATAA
jgi:transposase